MRREEYKQSTETQQRSEGESQLTVREDKDIILFQREKESESELESVCEGANLK